MPTIRNNPYTLLQGLSDFWTRFFADYGELEALYEGTELAIAQTYLDMVSSFLNISIQDTPLFNTEYFKLITAREDQVAFDEAEETVNNRHRMDMPDTLVQADILQNKVVQPTASMDIYAGYDVDTTEYDFLFEEDPTGYPGRVLDQATLAFLDAYGTGTLAKCYVTTGTPFQYAKPGYWVRITGSAGGTNDKTFPITEKINDQTVVLQNVTLPETNSGTLSAFLIDSEFTPIEGFAHRSLSLVVGGSFDDPTRRIAPATEVGSWYANSPAGLGIRKGDLVHITDRDAVPTVPTDLTIAVVRHDKLYMSTDTPVPQDATDVDYVVLRTPFDKDVEEGITFEETGTAKDGIDGSIVEYDGGPCLLITAPVLADTDKLRFVTISRGPLDPSEITWTAEIAQSGTLTWQAGSSVRNPLARAAAGGTITLSGTPGGLEDGAYTILTIANEQVCYLDGTFTPATVTAKLDVVTNNGTYRIKKVIDANKAILDLPVSYNDPHNNSLTWRIHDGYKASFSHEYVVKHSETLRIGIGDSFTGGRRNATRDLDYVADYDAGTVLQIGRYAGLWGLGTVNTVYEWRKKILSAGTTGVATTTDTELLVTEVAFWAPDAKVDKYHLYNNYGYLIERFAPSSEQYREFIRGVFQLYMMGPTMERIESALNVIAAYPVIRDDGETLTEFDTSNAATDVVRTLRLNGEVGEYEFPKAVVTPPDTIVRADIAAWTESDDPITFDAFEPLTILFQVTDYVQDPTWWTTAVIPAELMPNESAFRRTASPLLYEHVIGAPDLPHIGDPGFFIGADDEGVIPTYSDAPPKRRKMANVVLERFLKHHLFYVRFDDNVYELTGIDFAEDLMDLILVAKPGYTMVYIEPTKDFIDVVRATETDVTIAGATIIEAETMPLAEQPLTIQSGSWRIGEIWRRGTLVPNETLFTTDGLSIEAPVNLSGERIITLRVNGPAYVAEFHDYIVDYKEGILTPLTMWPAGFYTAEYTPLIVGLTSSKDESLGDMNLTIGGMNPFLVRPRMTYLTTGAITTSGGCKYFADINADFLTTLHKDKPLMVYHTSSTERLIIERVISPTQVLLTSRTVSDNTDLKWGFATEEPTDAELYAYGSDWRLQTGQMIFKSWHKGHYVQVMDSLVGNNGYHKILDVVNMYTVALDERAHGSFSFFTADTEMHIRLEGTPNHMSLVERPVQITITT